MRYCHWLGYFIVKKTSLEISTMLRAFQVPKMELCGYGLCKVKPSPKIAEHEVQYLPFRYVKFLVICGYLWYAEHQPNNIKYRVGSMNPSNQYYHCGG